LSADLWHFHGTNPHSSIDLKDTSEEVSFSAGVFVFSRKSSYFRDLDASNSLDGWFIVFGSMRVYAPSTWT
jgi:hypothetical protein